MIRSKEFLPKKDWTCHDLLILFNDQSLPLLRLVCQFLINWDGLINVLFYTIYHLLLMLFSCDILPTITASINKRDSISISYSIYVITIYDRNET